MKLTGLIAFCSARYPERSLGADQPVDDIRPNLAQNPLAHEQAEMAAVGGQLAEVTRRRTNQTLNSEQLRRRHQFVIARRKEKNRHLDVCKIDWLA
jgi:hypothetical protein